MSTRHTDEQKETERDSREKAGRWIEKKVGTDTNRQKVTD